MKEFFKNAGIPEDHQGRMDYIWDFYAGPITYAKQLKDAVTTKAGGGLKGRAYGWVAGAAPIAVPTAFTLIGVSNENIAGGVLGGLFFWTISGAAVRVLKEEGFINPDNRKGDSGSS